MDFPWLVCAITFGFLTISLQNVLLCSPDGYVILTNTQGHVSSPNYPKYNPKATQCHWLISVQERYTISLEFEVFDVGHTSECSGYAESRKTYVEVRDGTNSTSIGTFCGSNKPKTISSSTNQMWIQYVTNGYKSTRFVARYTATKDSSVAVIISLALAAISGTIVCVVITIVFIRRRNPQQSDDEINPPSRDIHPDNDVRACAMAQIPSLILLGKINKGMSDCDIESMSLQYSSKNENAVNYDSNFHDNQHNDVTIENNDDSNHTYNQEKRRCQFKQNMAIIDTDNVVSNTTQSRLSDSMSVLTTAKVIFVQDSLSSRSSSSSSSNSTAEPKGTQKLTEITG